MIPDGAREAWLHYIGAMHRRLLLLAPLIGAPALAQPRPPSAPPPPPMPGAADIAAIEAYLNGIRTLRARFLQVDARGNLANGTLYMQRPGRARFEYDPPSPVLIVADGTTVTFQDRQLGQTSAVLLGQTPLSIILAERVQLSGAVTVLRGERFANRLEVWLARAGSLREGTLILSFTTEPMQLAQWRVIDAQAQEVRVTLSAIERDMPLEARLFRAPQQGASGSGG